MGIIEIGGVSRGNVFGDLVIMLLVVGEWERRGTR